MTAEEWDACTNPADMLDALTEAKYPAEYIQFAAATIAEDFQMTGEQWWEYVNDCQWAEERETKARQWERVSAGIGAIRKPDCPDPARQFREAMSHFTLELPPAADFLRKTFPNPFRPPLRADCVTG